MKEVLLFSLKLLFGVFESWWRRWFGGGYIGGSSKENKWYNIRAFQHIIGGVVMFLSLFYLSNISGHIWKCLYTVAIIQGFFWARAHGPAFDISRGGLPDEETKQRYKKEWWNKICEFVVPEREWYGYGYDALWMKLRYVVYPALLVPIMGWKALFIGLVVTPIYSICWALYDRQSPIFNKLPSWMQVSGPTSLAEWVVGLTTGLLLVFI